jgi:hypothetical protein
MTHPFVGGLVRRAIILKRASECRHDWSAELDGGEVQCRQCSIIAASRAFADSLPFGTQPAPLQERCRVDE